MQNDITKSNVKEYIVYVFFQEFYDFRSSSFFFLIHFELILCMV